MAETSIFEIRLMEERDYDEVSSLLINSFFIDEPITRTLRVKSPFQFTKTIIDRALKDRGSFVAVDGDSKSVVGVCLNIIEDRINPVSFTDEDENFQFLLNTLDAVHGKISIFDRLNANRLLHVFMVGVDKKARGHSLALHLVEKSLSHAAENNVDGAFAEATNVYSLNPMKKLRFQVLNELVYAEYAPDRLGSMTDSHIDRCYLVGYRFP